MLRSRPFAWVARDLQCGPQTPMNRLSLGPITCILGLGIPTACASDGGGGNGETPNSVIVSAAKRKPRTTTWSVNYWTWTPSFGDDISGTESQVAALKPGVLRIGGYNNDANTPDPFDHAQLDRAVSYARAIGAEPLLQVPLLADIDGSPATAESAAALVQYANVSQSYGIKYFSVGNEPDLYATEGSRSDMTAPAIPSYAPSDYCNAVRAYATAMKAVDPTIKIVGPELSWHYVPGFDWLTPILQGCGDLFDIVSIHRYPFNSTQATLAAAEGDSATFADEITAVRGLMQSAGYGDKPLALTEMNVVYDATACELGASPSTMGSALWLADGLGTAIEHDLWTSALWDISDDDVWALGLLGLPPGHAPRPAYYAYQLYADHFGPTLIEVTQQPPGVRAYASRSATDDATDLIVVNWNTSSVPLALQVTGLATSVDAPSYTLPALSISAVEIRDQGASTAWTYGEAQRQTGQAVAVLAPGAFPATDAGPPELTNDCSHPAAVSCSQVVLPGPWITTIGAITGSELVFGTAPYQWDSYTYAADGQTAPTATLTPDGNGMEVTGGFVPPVTGNWMGVGLYLDNLSCVDGSRYSGVRFDFSGDLDGCSLAFGSNFSGDETPTDDPARGVCSDGESACYPPSSVVSAPANASGATTIKVPFSALAGGSPHPVVDPSTIITVQWQLGIASGATGCTAKFTLANVAFY
jgi:hypothetical protein